MKGLLEVRVLGMGVGLLSLCVMYDRDLQDDHRLLLHKHMSTAKSVKLPLGL